LNQSKCSFRPRAPLAGYDVQRLSMPTPSAPSVTQRVQRNSVAAGRERIQWLTCSRTVAGYQRNRSCGYCKTSDGSMQIPPHSVALAFLFLVHRRQRHCPEFVNMLAVELADFRLIAMVQRFVILHLERQIENRPLSGTHGQGLETVGLLSIVANRKPGK
jgi:hypothetical protein